MMEPTPFGNEFALGNSERFIQALRALHDRLGKDPNGFGEPLYRLPALKMVVTAM